MQPDLLSLAARVEKLTGPSKEVDRAVARVVGWFRVEPRHSRNRYGGWIAPDDFIGAYRDGSPMLDGLHGTTIWRDPPAWTASVDAVLALIARELPGCGPGFSQDSGLAGKAGACHASIDQSEEDWTYEGWPPVRAATPALALLSAALRAKAAQQQMETDRP